MVAGGLRSICNLLGFRWGCDRNRHRRWRQFYIRSQTCFELLRISHHDAGQICALEKPNANTLHIGRAHISNRVYLIAERGELVTFMTRAAIKSRPADRTFAVAADGAEAPNKNIPGKTCVSCRTKPPEVSAVAERQRSRAIKVSNLAPA